MSNIVEEVCRTIRVAIEEEGRTSRLIAIIVAVTVCALLFHFLAE